MVIAPDGGVVVEDVVGDADVCLELLDGYCW